jgi:hypothetical protein
VYSMQISLTNSCLLQWTPRVHVDA